MVGDLILVGGGEHAGVLADAVRVGGSTRPVLGYVDKVRTAAMAERGVPYLGDDDAIAEHHGAAAVLGVGSNGSTGARRALVSRIEPLIQGWVRVFHPAAVIAADASIGPGTVVMAGAVIETGAVIGAHCIVNTGAIVCHDVRMEDHVVVSAGAVVGGAVVLGSGSFIGLGAAIRDHRSVGSEAVVAMGAVVISDVAPGSTVGGVPAAPLAR